MTERNKSDYIIPPPALPGGAATGPDTGPLQTDFHESVPKTPDWIPPPGSPVPIPPFFPPGPTGAQMSAVPPGSPVLPADGCPHPDLQPLWDALAAIEEGVTASAVKVIAAVGDVLTNCQAKYNELAALVVGKLDTDLDKGSETYAKCVKKCQRAMDSGLTTAYSYAVPMGLCYPTQEQVLYGLQTGQCLQTLVPGWLPTGDGSASCDPNYVQEVQTKTTGETETTEQRSILTTDFTKTKTETTTTKTDDGKTVNVVVNVPQEAPPVVNVNVDSTAKTTKDRVNKGEADKVKGIITSTLETILRNQTNTVTIYDKTTKETKTGDNAITYLINQLTETINNTVQADGGGGGQPVPDQIAINDGPRAGGLLPPDWNSPNVCAGIDAFGAQLLAGANPLADALEFKQEGNTLWMPAWAFSIYEALPTPLDKLFWGVGRIVWQVINGTTQWVIQNVGGGLAQAFVPALMKVVAGVVNRWVGHGLADFLKGYEYWINYLLPTFLPTTADANSAFLNDTITEDLWRCWVRANNDLEFPAKLVRNAQGAKPSILEAIQLFRFGYIERPEYEQLLRRNGVLNEIDRGRIELASQALPGVSDIISFMVKDVADPKIVDAYQLDQDFEAKWTGLLRKYGDAQGIGEELARYYWRAHWNYPSPEQSFRMAQRLRPGRVPANIETTSADVLKLLEVNDYAPFWRERLLAISYMPLTRTDVQRAYEINAVTKAQVKEAYLDEGYNDRDAQVLADFTEKLKVRTLQQRRPPAEASRYVSYYLKYALTLDDLKDVLRPLIFEDQVYDKTIKDAENRRALDLVSAKLKLYRLQFTKGQWDEDFTKRALLTLGMKDGEATDLLTVWKGDRPLTLRHVTAAQICKAANTGLMTRVEQATRLVNLGYSAKDAEILIGECRDGLTQKQQAAAAKRAKEQEAANAKVAKQTVAQLKAQFAAQKKDFFAQIKDLDKQILELNKKLAAAGGGAK